MHQPDTPGTIDADRPIVVVDATCTACGCLCDDIVLTARSGRIVEAGNACDRGRAWFLTDHGRGDRPAASIEGRPVAIGAALDRAAALLGAARSPLVTGLTSTTVEAQAAAVALADRLGAIIVPGHADEAAPRLEAFRRVGAVSATLGEVKARADVVVFWGVDPIATHPRHWERYSVEPAGRFVPEGRSGRTILVAGASRTTTADRADAFLPVAPEAQLEALACLRALLRGAEPDADRVGRSGGFHLDDLRDWAGRLSRAKYGAFFFGSDLGRSPGGAGAVEAALLLVRDLNESTRFVALTLGGPGNRTGAEAVLTWQSGFPLGADFARGYPRPPFGEATATSLLAGGLVDAALIVADDPSTDWPAVAIERLTRLPTIVIAPGATDPERVPAPTVAFDCATTGVHAPGTVVRSDGIQLPLRPALATDLSTDRDLLRVLDDRLARIAGRI